jgi:nitroreductase
MPLSDTAAGAAAMSQLLAAHRSIRQYDAARDVSEALLDEALAQAFQGSSSSGNLNMSSVIVTRDPARRQRLYELHGEQPMVLQAPVVLTFCADTHRTRTWLAQRGARLGFAEFVSWHVAAFDAVIFAQSAALALESRGLGICYMGTTLFAMRALAAELACPPQVLPVTSLVVGWPAEAPAQRDRLPASAWLHRETYTPPTAEKIDADYARRDERGWARYRDGDPEVVKRMDDAGITSLAQFYTSQLKYDPDRLGEFAADLHRLLVEQGFLAAEVPAAD